MRRKQVAVARMLVEQAERQAKRLAENYDQWGWLGGYEDVVDRIRQPGKELYAPMSTVNDRRWGHNWPFWRTSAEHARLRATARLLCGLSPIATGALCGLRAYIIGEGFSYRAATDQRAPEGLVGAVQAVIDEFLVDACWRDYEQELFLRSRRDGEVFLLHEAVSKGRTGIEVVEPEQVQAPPGEVGDSEDWTYGIETRGRRTHRPLRYHVVEDVATPGEFFGPDELFHLKVNVDAKVKRGLSDFSYDTHDAIRTAGRLVDHVGQGAAIQASIAFIRQHATASPSQVEDFISAASDYDRYDPISGRTEESERFHPGKILDVDKGQEYIVPPFASNVSGYVEVIQAILRAVAVRWNAPEWILSADASGTNYASSVTAESPFVKRCYQEQEVYKAFFRRTIERVIRAAAKNGRIRAYGRTWDADVVAAVVQVHVEAPSVEVRDDYRTAQVDQIYASMGVKSVRQIQQQLGIDADQAAADNADAAGVGQPGLDAPHPPGTPDPGGDPTAELRGSVGGSQALLTLQQAYYQGALPRDACIANARIVYGFRQEDAEALFPEKEPDAPGKEDSQGEGQEDGTDGPPDGGDLPPDATGGAEPAQPAQVEGDNPLDDVLFGDEADPTDETPADRPGPALSESERLAERLAERETKDKRGYRICYDDGTGKRTKCPPKEGEKPKERKKKEPDDGAAGGKKPSTRKLAAPKKDTTSSPEKVQAARDALKEATTPEEMVAALTAHNHATLKDLAKLLGEKAYGGSLAIANRLAQALGVGKDAKPDRPGGDRYTTMSKSDIIQDVIRTAAGRTAAGPALATHPSHDPWGVMKGFPDGVDAAAVSGTILGALKAAKAKNSLTRPTISQLYQAAKAEHPDLTVNQFQQTLAELHRRGHVRLGPYTQALASMPVDDIRVAFPLDRELKNYVDVGPNADKPAALPAEPDEPAPTASPVDAAHAAAEALGKRRRRSDAQGRARASDLGRDLNDLGDVDTHVIDSVIRHLNAQGREDEIPRSNEVLRQVDKAVADYDENPTPLNARETADHVRRLAALGPATAKQLRAMAEAGETVEGPNGRPIDLHAAADFYERHVPAIAEHVAAELEKQHQEDT